MFKHPRMVKRSLPAIIGLAAVLATAACGGGSKADTGAGGGPFVVGTIPNVSSVTANLGVDRGTFKQNGLDVQLKTATGFAPNLASVVNGETQVGFAAVIPLLVAKSKGAPIRIVAATDAAAKTYDPATDPASVAVKPDSPIKEAKDLEGKTVAVTALGSIQDLGVKVKVKADGADPSKVKFLALPSNDMISALEAGRVDAVALSEPFSTTGREKGLRSLFSYTTQAIPGEPVGEYFTSEQTLSKRGKDITAFVKSVNQLTDMITKDPSIVRSELPKFTKINAQAAAKVHTYEYTTTITPEQIDELSKQLVDFGYMTKPVTPKQILRSS